MERAIAFYEQLFEQEVTKKDIIYSVFDVNGFRFGLFANEQMEEIHTYGTNCLPSIDVESKNILMKMLKGRQVVFPLTKIGVNWVAEIADSEGNHIEITAPVKEEV